MFQPEQPPNPTAWFDEWVDKLIEPLPQPCYTLPTRNTQPFQPLTHIYGLNG